MVCIILVILSIIIMHTHVIAIITIKEHHNYYHDRHHRWKPWIHKLTSTKEHTPRTKEQQGLVSWPLEMPLIRRPVATALRDPFVYKCSLSLALLQGMVQESVRQVVRAPPLLKFSDVVVSSMDRPTSFHRGYWCRIAQYSNRQTPPSSRQIRKVSLCLPRR